MCRIIILSLVLKKEQISGKEEPCFRRVEY